MWFTRLKVDWLSSWKNPWLANIWPTRQTSVLTHTLIRKLHVYAYASTKPVWCGKLYYTRPFCSALPFTQGVVWGSWELSAGQHFQSPSLPWTRNENTHTFTHRTKFLTSKGTRSGCKFKAKSIFRKISLQLFLRTWTASTGKVVNLPPSETNTTGGILDFKLEPTIIYLKKKNEESHWCLPGFITGTEWTSKMFG